MKVNFTLARFLVLLFFILLPTFSYADGMDAYGSLFGILVAILAIVVISIGLSIGSYFSKSRILLITNIIFLILSTLITVSIAVLIGERYFNGLLFLPPIIGFILLILRQIKHRPNSANTYIYGFLSGLILGGLSFLMNITHSFQPIFVGFLGFLIPLAVFTILLGHYLKRGLKLDFFTDRQHILISAIKLSITAALVDGLFTNIHLLMMITGNMSYDFLSSISGETLLTMLWIMLPNFVILPIAATVITWLITMKPNTNGGNDSSSGN